MGGTLDTYVDHLNEDFTFVKKVFKANLLKRIAIKMQKSVKGNNVNIPALKAALKPIPSMTQDKINVFMDKYVPNYKANYNTSKRHFDKKYPENQNNDAMAGVTAAATGINQKRTLQDNIKHADRVYSKAVLTGIPSGFIVMLLGLAVVMTTVNIPEMFETGGGQLLAVVVGIMMMISGLLSGLQRGN